MRLRLRKRKQPHVKVHIHSLIDQQALDEHIRRAVANAQRRDNTQ